MQFKRNVTSGIEQNKTMALYELYRLPFPNSFLLKNKILPIINGKAIIIEYSLQSGNKAIHNGIFFNISCKCKIKTLSHKSIMGQVIVMIEKIINIASKSNVFFIVIYHILHNDLCIYDLGSL